MDKAVTNQLLESAGIARAKSLWFHARDYESRRASLCRDIEETLGGYPIFVKPANAGSSVGISKVKEEAELDAAVAKAAQEDGKIVLEETIVGQEVECAVLGNEEPRASLVGEVGAAAEFYDYDDKYVNGVSKLYIPRPDPGGNRRSHPENGDPSLPGAGMPRAVPDRFLCPRIRRRHPSQRTQYPPRPLRPSACIPSSGKRRGCHTANCCTA